MSGIMHSVTKLHPAHISASRKEKYLKAQVSVNKKIDSDSPTH